MVDSGFGFLHSVFGAAENLDALGFEHMVARAVVIYVAGLVIIRFGKNRLLGRTTAFDIVLAFILGSLLSRAINGSAPPLPSLAAAAVLVVMHWMISHMTMRSDRMEDLLKGHRVMLVEEGSVRPEAMRRSEVSEQDLREALRLNANVADPSTVAAAYLERNGQISAVRGTAEPRVVEIDVAEGVQRVRLELVS